MRLPRILLVILTFPPTAWAVSFQISDINIEAHRDGDTFALTINGTDNASPDYQVSTMADPDRLVIDLQHAAYTASLPSAISGYSSKLIKGVRTVSRQDGSLRYILDLNYPPSSYRSELQHADHGAYLLKVRLVTPELPEEAQKKITKQALLVPTEQPGIFELQGTTASKLLDFRNSRRATIDAKEFIALFGKPTPSPFVNVIGAEMQSSGKGSELALDLSGPAEHTMTILQNPLRAVVDIKNARGPDRVNAQHLSDSLAKRVRSGQHAGFLRVVIELTTPAYVQSFLLDPTKNHGYRLIVRISQVPPQQQGKPKLANLDEQAPATGLEQATAANAHLGLQEAILPLYVDGKDRGEIFSLISSQDTSKSRLDGAALLDAVKPTLIPRIFAAVKALQDENHQVSFTSLESKGLKIDYDAEKLALHISTPPEFRALRYHNLHSRQQQPPVDSDNAIMPAPLSAALDVIAAQTWNTGQPRIFTSEFDGDVNISGWVLQNRTSYEKNSTTPWQRRETQLIKDWREIPLRLSIGDIAYPAYGLMGNRPLSGASVGTLFSIQPYNVTFPISHHEFFLEQNSQVRVFVNDVERTTLNLTAGSHDVFDFPLVDGVNRVRLEVTDIFGRKRTLHFFDSMDQRLLRPRLAEYNFAAGIERNFTATGLQYDNSASAFSGFYRYGYSDSLTIGGHMEFDDNITMLGTSGIWSTLLGNLDYDLAFSHDAQAARTVSPAIRIGYLYRDLTWGMNAGATWQDSAFSTLGQRADDDNLRYSAIIGINLPIWRRWSSNLSLSTYKQWSGRSRSTQRLSSTRYLSRDWRIGIELSHTVDAGVHDNTVMLDFYWFDPARRLSNSFGYDTGAQEGYYAVDYTRRGELGLDAHNMTRRSPSQLSNQFQTSYVSSTLESSFSSLDIYPDLADNTSLRTVSAGTAITYVDGEFAMSRPLHGQSFALIEAKPSIGDGRLGVIRGFGSKPFMYLHGAGDSAVLPNLSPYYVTQIKLDPLDLALDAQLEKQTFDVLPGYRSGIKIEVGMEGIVYLSGKLLFADQTPVALQTGRIRSLDHADTKPIPFFTDESGHFEAADLRPGRYSIMLSGHPDLSSVVNIPADRFGLYEVGDVKLKVAAHPAQ